MPQCSQLPARAGVGLKPEHYAALLDACRGGGDFLGDWCPQWVEVHPQNYFGKGGPPHRWLTEVASEMPLSFHSTALSLGSADGPDDAELDQLAALVSRYQPASISDHLSWSNTGPSGAGGEKFPDLLPVPYTRAALAILQRNVDMVQNRLARRILIENPSRYLSFADDEMDEVDFIGQLCAETGCGLLLDINNIEVSATNLGFNASAYLARIDPALVGEIRRAQHRILQRRFDAESRRPRITRFRDLLGALPAVYCPQRAAADAAGARHPCAILHRTRRRSRAGRSADGSGA